LSTQISATANFVREIDSDTVLAQFNRLMNDLLNGQKRETLRRYQKAVQRQMEKGGSLPMKLSEYLEANRVRRVALESRATVS
jgi:hypothetical protein